MNGIENITYLHIYNKIECSQCDDVTYVESEKTCINYMLYMYVAV